MLCLSLDAKHNIEKGLTYEEYWELVYTYFSERIIEMSGFKNTDCKCFRYFNLTYRVKFIVACVVQNV